jgi:hypothetical protein
LKNLIIFVINIHTGGREMSENNGGASIEGAVERGKEFLEAKKRAAKPWSQSAKQAQSQRLKDYYQTHPEKRQELSKKIRAGWTKDRRKEFSKRMRRVLAEKEIRQKISEGLKRHWDSYHRWKEEQGDE